MSEIREKSRKPILSGEIPGDIEKWYSIDNQFPIRKVSKKGSVYFQLYLYRTCSKCLTVDPVKVNSIRGSLKNGTLCGMCPNCACRNKRPRKNIVGRKVQWGGYVYVLAKDHPMVTGDGYVMEHRLVMEKMIGRYLLPNETVHHKNGIKGDNREENLELWTQNHSTGVRYDDLETWQIEQLIAHLESVLANLHTPSTHLTR